MDKGIVTIARCFGSNGRSIGKKIAEKLGIDYYDKDIAKLASEDSGISENLFAQHDEKPDGNILNKPLFKKTKAYSGQIITPDKDNFTSEENLFNYQAKTIKALADKGSAVFVGRCADKILEGYDGVIRVFVWADMLYCEKNVMERYSIDQQDAVKLIERVNRERRNYHKIHAGSDWDNVRNYDLCLNSSELGIDKCVDIICGNIELRK